MKISEPKLKKVLDALDLREATELVKGKYKGGGKPPLQSDSNAESIVVRVFERTSFTQSTCKMVEK